MTMNTEIDQVALALSEENKALAKLYGEKSKAEQRLLEIQQEIEQHERDRALALKSLRELHSGVFS